MQCDTWVTLHASPLFHFQASHRPALSTDATAAAAADARCGYNLKVLLIEMSNNNRKLLLFFRVLPPKSQPIPNMCSSLSHGFSSKVHCSEKEKRFPGIRMRIRSVSTFSHIQKVGNNGIVANFVFPYSCSFLYYLYFKMLVNVKLDCQVVKGITFIGPLNFEWHGQNKVGNIAILVL